jgi:DNA polymerase III epsilon subunit-like protein
VAFGIIAPERLIAVSLETTGLDPLHDGITEVGALRFDYEGRLLDTFWERANPSIPVPEDITRLTGISDSMLEGARTPPEVVKDLFAWAGPGAWLAAHSGVFEAGFLHAAVPDVCGGADDSLMINTLEWARSLTLDVADYKLGTLADLINFDIRVSPLHGTLVGAQAVADLVLFLLKRCYPHGFRDLLFLRTQSLSYLAERGRAKCANKRSGLCC